ncbi:MAG: phosphate acyltransferase [Ponticaulis sp.]|nr:phosphate acyltransferase [Ponticaulis sp.]
MSSNDLVLSVDAMGGDNAPGIVLEGLLTFVRAHPNARALVHGDASKLSSFIDQHAELKAACEIRHTDKAVAMDAKPSQALKGRKDTSMCNMLESVKTGEASVAVSAGNTGALMAMSTFVLKRMPGVHRPALTALWPTVRGSSVVLDVGANVEVDAEQLVEFAIMGSAYARAINGLERPTIGLLNIGSEEMKGIETVKGAAELLRNLDIGLNYKGFVEGNDISLGTTDVVVTDGYTGNIALKTAEGTAKFIGGLMRDALKSSPVSMAGGLLARSSLSKLKDRIDPNKINGGVLLGVNGIVLKSHGGATAEGFATALRIAYSVGNSTFIRDVEESLTLFKASQTDTRETIVS